MKKRTLLSIYSALICSVIFMYSCKKNTGCTDHSAKNYDPAAVVDDESCEYYRVGCTDRNALNYDPHAEISDNKCVYPDGYVQGSFSSGNEGNETNGSNPSNGVGEPDEKQGCFVFEYTGTWCGPCGDWGAPKFEDMINHSEKVRGMTIHVGGDPMKNDNLANWFGDHFDYSGTPTHYVGHDQTYNTSAIDAILASDPVANTSFVVEDLGGEYQVKGTVKFFQNGDADHEYFVAIYVVEDHIGGGTDNAQSTQYEQNGVTDPNFEHHTVGRAFATSTPEGVSIGTAPTAGFKTNFEETITIDPSWDEGNLIVYTVIWKKDSSGSYYFVNAN